MCGWFCIGLIDFVFTGKKLTDFTNLFSPYDFEKIAVRSWVILKVILLKQLIEHINLTDQTKLRLNKISKIEIYFNQEIKDRKLSSKKLSKYVASFDYIDKILIVLSATSGGVSVISFTTLIGASVGIASTIFTLIFSLTTGIIKKLLNVTRNKKKTWWNSCSC